MPAASKTPIQAAIEAIYGIPKLSGPFRPDEPIDEPDRDDWPDDAAADMAADRYFDR